MSRLLVPVIRGLSVALLAASCGTDVLPMHGGPFSITTQGGTISLAGGLVELVVPAGAVQQDTFATLAISSNPPASSLLVSGTAVDLEPTGLAFLQPVQLTVHYGALALPAGVLGRELRVNTVVGGAWQAVPGSSVDEATQTVSASLSHFSTYGLVAVPVASLSVAPQAAVINVGGALQLAATPTDGDGAVLPNRAVSWTSSDPGVATVDAATGMVRGVATGHVQITATSEGVAATDSVSVAATAANLVFTTQPGNTDAGASFGVVVTARDAQGSTASGFTGTVTVAIGTNPGGGTLSGTKSVSAVAGVATFSGLSINKAASGYTLTATASGMASAVSAPFDITTGGISTSRSVVTVSSGTVVSGSTVTLALQARDPNGNNITTGGATVVFTRSGGTSTGTIGSTTDNHNGTYTATFTGVTAGTATTIHATIDGAAVTSQLPTVTVTPGTIDRTKSTVSLSASSAPPGGSAVTVTLRAKDAAGNNLTTGGATVAFSHSGGTSVITIGATTDVGNGTYTAPITPVTEGTATTLSATINGQAVTTTMPTFTVSTTPSWRANEPAGLTLFNERHFDAKLENSWYLEYPPDNDFTIQQDATAPVSPPNIGQARYPQGLPAGVGPIDTEIDLPGGSSSLSEIYLAFPLKLSSNFYGCGTNKIFFIWIGGQPGVYLKVDGNGNGSLAFEISTQSSGSSQDPLAIGRTVTRNQWTNIEVYMKVNTAGNSDGIVKIWQDGTQTINVSNVRFVSGSAVPWERVAWNPTWGGGCSGTVPADQFMWMDDVYISGRH
jgi:hypothetical protein